VSKERALRRAEREREAAVRAAARAREAERRERRLARRRALLGWVPRPRLQPGLLAARRRRELTTTVAILLALNVLVWVVTTGWAARVGAVLVSLLVAPVLHLMVRRR
jgi:Flp pilus assembly protein TadB